MAQSTIRQTGYPITDDLALYYLLRELKLQSDRGKAILLYGAWAAIKNSKDLPRGLIRAVNLQRISAGAPGQR